MIVKEYCRYVRSYSELEGLQLAHTLCYSAHRTDTGIVLELAQEQGQGRSVCRVLYLSESFPQAMRLMKYLCENGVGPGQWLNVLEDLHQPFRPLTALDTAQTVQIVRKPERFVAFV